MNTTMSRNTIGLLFCTAFLLSVHAGLAQNVMQKIEAENQINHFSQALKDADLDKKLGKSGPFTIFAPLNKDFDGLAANQKSSKKLLLNHIFTGMATERSLHAMDNVTFLSGKTVSINEEDQQLSVGSFTVIRSNIMADNGVIHIISGVIK